MATTVSARQQQHDKVVDNRSQMDLNSEHFRRCTMSLICLRSWSWACFLEPSGRPRRHQPERLIRLSASHSSSRTPGHSHNMTCTTLLAFFFVTPVDSVPKFRLAV